MNRITNTTFLIVLLALWPLSSCRSNAQQWRPIKLSSGRVVKVLGTGPINFSQGPPALMLKYQTDLQISDKEALRKEVDEIWAAFKIDADNGNFRSAIVSANEEPKGFILKRSSAYNFVYEKRADGEWHSLEGDKRK